ncbi:hypothetical protein CSA56_15585 [candidate division KSB3 bacterium]|uniref:Phosphohistidine phosphatase SixA n=1 Tax=candidate division KSB3 bacterium TaxID=2044937 RepID=A0A2G6KC95_9BACT|nr:MAG: hypothetical protein CSA56_15585 [candidate division KSB3 bacterium]
MKTLYIVRHAKAISRESGINDFKRSLSKQGQNDAKAMAKRLQKKGISPDLLLSSPADRALETAHLFAGQFEYPIQNIQFNDHIYDEDAGALREIVKQLDDRFHAVMMFGHEPSLSEFARELLQDTEIALRTTGVLGISLEIDHWQELSEKSGSLMLFDFPVRATPKAYKMARQTIARDITASMEDILEQIAGDASKHLDKVIEKTSKKLAKELTKVLQASKVEDISGIRAQGRVDKLGRSRFYDIPPAEGAVAQPETDTPESLDEQTTEPKEQSARQRRLPKPEIHDKSPAEETGISQKQPRKVTSRKK